MSSFSSDFTKIRLHYTNLLNRLPLMPSVPEPTYTLPEDASSEDIYELINTLPLPSRCNAIIIKLSKITWKIVTPQGATQL